MNINFNEIVIYLSDETDNFTENDKKYFHKYIETTKIINNMANSLKLNDKIFEFDEKINYNNYDFSDRFLNLRSIISLLEIFNLTTLNTYEICNFFYENKMKYNIWKYLNITEYVTYDSLDYDDFVLIRVCISYSWKECLYDLLKKCLNKSRSYKIFIWIDLFCVNQFNEKIKKKGLDKIDNVYGISDIYSISSLDAFKRYWRCYEMSLKKDFIDGGLINKADIKMNINLKLKENFNKVFNNDNILLYNDDNKIKEYVLEFNKIKEFKKNNFELKKADITYEKDKKFIENKILEKYKSIEEYENRINIYIYLIMYRDDMSYSYLANKIMNYQK